METIGHYLVNQFLNAAITNYKKASFVSMKALLSPVRLSVSGLLTLIKI